MAPVSRGNLTIRSASMHDAPVINPNIFTSRTDQQVAVAAFKRMRQMLAQPEMAPILVGDEYYPGKSVVPAGEAEEDVLRWLRDAASVYYHAGATCRLASRD